MSTAVELTRRAIDAAVAVASAHGIDACEPIVLQDRANVLVHLPRAGVVARVATTSSLMRDAPEAFLAREVSLCRYLVAHGARVVPPADVLPPGPHVHDGLAMSFWPFVAHEAGAMPPVGDLAAELADLHRTLRGYDGALTYLNPVLGEVPRVIAGLAATDLVDAADLDRMRAEEASLRARLAPLAARAQPLHGDSHQANVLVTPGGGFLWNDLEDTCSGPVAWDLAVLLRRAPPDERGAALERYRAAGGAAVTMAEIDLCIEARTLQLCAWMVVMAAQFSAYREPSETLLADLRRRAAATSSSS